MEIKYGKNAAKAFETLLVIITKLRNPDNGCPWDKKQTISTLLPHVLEETYECIDAVHNKDTENLSEEIGDLYLLITMISYILEQTEQIPVYETINGISKKLIRRHPHVFGNLKVNNANDVIAIWNNVKTEIEKKPQKDSLLDSVPLSTPPLERSYSMQKIASKAGFDWNNSHDVFKKITEEITEFEDALESENSEEMAAEFGDVLFSLINAARFAGIDPVKALHRTNQKFANRFKYIEKQLKERSIKIDDASIELMETFWQEAKKLQK